MGCFNGAVALLIIFLLLFNRKGLAEILRKKPTDKEELSDVEGDISLESSTPAFNSSIQVFYIDASTSLLLI